MKKYKWFTVIELIVVITILAILWTISFVSFGNYNKWARDSVRMTDISSIYNALTLYTAQNWTLVNPDDSVEIRDNIWNLSYQWYLKDQVLNSIWINKWWKDPLDKTYFLYTVKPERRFFQLSAYLESQETVSKYWFQDILAWWIDYKNRYPYTKWDYVWLFMDNTTNKPIDLTDWTIIDITWTNSWTTYKVLLSSRQTDTWSTIVDYWTWLSYKLRWYIFQKITTETFDWQCWPDDWKTLSSLTNVTLCSKWDAISLTGNWSWNRRCAWANWWTDAECHINWLNTNWSCWSSSWSLLSTAPENLCIAWTEWSIVLWWSWSTWNWTCWWIWTWIPATCQAKVLCTFDTLTASWTSLECYLWN